MLVGGEGTRLRPLTWTTPKQMLPIVEVTMIERVLGHLATFGIEDAILSMGYRPDVFLDAFPGGRAAGVRLTYAVEPEPLDTAGAIAFAATSAGVDDTFLVLNGDVLTDVDVDALIDLHRQRRAEGTIHLARVDDPSAFGVVPTDDVGRVLAFVEKPPRDEAPTDFINAGTYVLEPSVLARIPGGRRVSIEREVFPAMVADGSLYAMPSPAYWIDTGTPAKYLQAQLDLLDGTRGHDVPAPGASRREDGTWTLGAAVIDGTVTPPSLVGDAAFVGAGAHVERSVIGAGARVHDGASVRNSVLLPGAAVREGATVEDSIVGEQAVVGEGAKLQRLTVVGGGQTIAPGAQFDGDRVGGPIAAAE
ncbi:MAG: Mannose-phosphate guanylyltransferase [Acidimicrobiales bacterium]|nr:Mannose-phosphate guanylyltransferase [Acidimicrobiales bacterium]